MDFRGKLLEEQFIKTVELCPPKGIDCSRLIILAKKIWGKVDAINITDNQRANIRISPVAVCSLLLREKITPICQLTCRDRNRMALQSEILGAAALGIEYFLFLTGDHTLIGEDPRAKAVFDLDSVQLMAIANQFNHGLSLDGKILTGKPNLIYGGVVNPSAEFREAQLWKLERKVDAGIKFAQTQAVYSVREVADFIEEAKGLDIRVLVGIIPLKSAGMARYMNKYIPGIKVPNKFIDILEKAKNPITEGLLIAKETINELKGVADGVHIMPMGVEEYLEELVEKDE